jgi:TfoX/Sxy family transcriptional regulator of competence genes
VKRVQKQELAERVRDIVCGDAIGEKRMFGGVTFLVNGNMLCCTFEQGLMLRVGKDAEAQALSKPFVRPLSKTRKMSGFVFVEMEGLAGKAALSKWLRLGRAHVDQLPAKALATKPKQRACTFAIW